MRVTTKVNGEFKTFSCVAEYDQYKRDMFWLKVSGIGAITGILAIIIGMFSIH